MPTPLEMYLGEQTRADREMRAILVQAAAVAARRIEDAKGVGGRVRAGQLALVLGRIREAQFDLWTREIGPMIERYFPRVARIAEQAAISLENALMSALTQRQRDVLRESVQAQSEAGLVVDAARRSRELSRRVYLNADLASGRIERTIRASVVLGDSAREIAREVRKFIRPDTSGGVSYAAMRLGRTELNNAFHDRQVQGAQDRPWVRNVRWNLSRSHPTPDICNVYAAENDGLFLVNQVPDKPHPQCLCYMTYDLVDEDEAVQMALAAARSAA